MRTQVLVVLCVLTGCWACSEGAGTVIGPDVQDMVGERIEVRVQEMHAEAVSDSYTSDARFDGLGEQSSPECSDLGEFGCPCQTNDDCFAGFCVLHQGESVCTTSCLEECPEAGWTCKEYSGFGDPLFLCISDYTNLCWPCSSDAECKANGTNDTCISYGEEGSFCGGDCGKGGICPDGYVCETVTALSGLELEQCVAQVGTCECTGTAVLQNAWTPCEQSNEWGVCAGKRLCAEDGLTACDALSPAQESCNGLDDDCDGEVDFEGICDDGNPCTEDHCEPESGCVHAPLPDGQECIDGDPCTWKDKCAGGQCVGESFDCFDGNECTQDLCDPATGECDFPPNTEANGQECGLENQCMTGGICVDGTCMGSIELPCIDGIGCTLDDCNPLTGCLYTPDHVKCDDGNECTNDLCQPVCDEQGNCEEGTGCANVPAEEGQLCDDEDLCTEADMCVAGVCLGEKVEPDDGNPCTEDLCDPLTGIYHDIVLEGTSCGDMEQGPNWVCLGEVCECVPDCMGKVCGGDGCGGSCGQCEYPTEICADSGAACIGPPCTDSAQCLPGTFCNQSVMPGQCLPGCDVDAQCLAVCPKSGHHACLGDNTCLCVVGEFPGSDYLPGENGCLMQGDGLCVTADSFDSLAPPQGGMVSTSGKFQVKTTLIH